MIEEDALIQKTILNFQNSSHAITNEKLLETSEIEKIDPWSVRISESTIITLFQILLPESHREDEDLLIKEVDFCRSLYRKYQNQLKEYLIIFT